MAERNETLTTKKSADEALAAGASTIESLGLKIKQNAGGTIEAKGGSKLITYWIGLIAPESAIPVTVKYTVTDNGSSRTVQMYTKSTLLLSFYLWKYKKRANNIADGLKQGVSSKLN